MKNTKHILYKLRKHFPGVNKVVDAKTNVSVTVTKKDNKSAVKKDPTNCALAQACKREKHADGVIINIGVSYIIKGNVATRYKTSESVGREITSFDRGAGFEEGNNYILSSPAPSMRLDAPKRLTRPSGPHSGNKPHPHVIHRTSNIRVSKG